MRALLGLLVLGGLFVVAASWQESHTERLRAQRSREFGLPSAGEAHDDSWCTLVLGRKSGAEPIPTPDPAELAYAEPAPSADAAAAEPEPSFEPDYRYEVQKNDVLGKICQRHYGTARPRLVDAVARYNELASANDIRAGQILLLPDRELLEE